MRMAFFRDSTTRLINRISETKVLPAEVGAEYTRLPASLSTRGNFERHSACQSNMVWMPDWWY